MLIDEAYTISIYTGNVLLMQDGDVYYDPSRRGYPRSRIDYAASEVVSSSRYDDPIRYAMLLNLICL